MIAFLDAASFGLDSTNTSPNLSLRNTDLSFHETSTRCARQDSLRRRDMNLFYGLHPKLLHGSPGSPKLSLPPMTSSGTGPQRNSPMRPVRPALEKCTAGQAKHPLENTDHDLEYAGAAGPPPSSLEVPQGVVRSLSRDSTSSEEDLAGGRKNWIYEYMVEEKRNKIKRKAGEERQRDHDRIAAAPKDVENIDPDEDEENRK